ncbi:MAG: hypothetical protein WCH20_05170 [Nitrospira sp.]
MNPLLSVLIAVSLFFIFYFFFDLPGKAIFQTRLHLKRLRKQLDPLAMATGVGVSVPHEERESLLTYTFSDGNFIVLTVWGNGFSVWSPNWNPGYEKHTEGFEQLMGVIEKLHSPGRETRRIVMTRQWFENTFKVYLDEIERCVQSKCYWALLHIVLVLPDVCAAMETDDGTTGGKEYRGWCERYLADHSISAEDWYQMRCIILHQGRTIDAKQKSQYAAFAFSQPGVGIVHRCINQTPQGKVLQLDVREMAGELRIAMNKWFEVLSKNDEPQIVRNVTHHAEVLARSQDNPAMPIAMNVPTMLSLTTSSPWTPPPAT